MLTAQTGKFSCRQFGMRTRAASPRTSVGGLLTGRPPLRSGRLFVLPPPCAPRKRGSAGRVALQPVAIGRPVSDSIIELDPYLAAIDHCTRWLSTSLQRVAADHQARL
jgi:hypothetical protein